MTRSNVEKSSKLFQVLCNFVISQRSSVEFYCEKLTVICIALKVFANLYVT